MRAHFFFLFALLVGACFGETFVRLRLHRFAEDEDRLTVRSYAGHPEHLLALTVAFAVPRAFHSDALWNESATQGDLPGLYAGVYLSNADPLGRELTPGNGPGGTLLSLPRLRMQSLGTAHTWAVNMTLAQPAAFSTRGLFLLGPGSAVWLKARYARVTRTELQLRDSLSDLPSSDYRPLPCQWRDPQGRCVLQQDAYALRVEDRATGHAHIVHVNASGTRVILDLDSYTTHLPRSVAARLREDAKAKPSARRVDWIAPGTNTAWLLARASDLTSSALQTAALGERPRYAVSESSEHDDIIIGRQVALRQFSEMIYDSSEATWYVRAADVSETYTVTVRWVIAIALAVQALLVGRQMLNPDKLSIPHVYAWLYESGRWQRSKERPRHLQHWAYSLAVVTVACVQLILGLVYIGKGVDVDLPRVPALRATGITLTVAATLFAVVHLVLVVFVHLRGQYTLSLEFAASATYSLVGLSGLAASLLPRASQATCEMILLALLLALIVFFMLLHALVSVVVIPRRLLFTATAGDRAHFQQQTFLWVVMACLLTGLSLALVFLGGDLVFVDSVALMSVRMGTESASLLAQGLLLIVVACCVCFVLVETLQVDYRRWRRLQRVTEAKSD